MASADAVPSPNRPARARAGSHAGCSRPCHDEGFTLVTPRFFTPKTPVESRLIELGDVTLHLRHYRGGGPQVLLIHGIGSSSRDFDPVIDGLAGIVSPITVDLRGHGESSRPETGYHYEDYARDLAQLVDALGMDRPILLGHSLGGILTLWWAMHHPDRARALIIEDAPIRSGEEFRPAFDGWAMLNVLPFDAVREHYRAQHPDWPEYLVDTRAWDITNTKSEVISELRAASLSNQGLDSTDGMRHISAPVLFIHGDHETGSMVHPEDLSALPDRLPTVRLARIPGGGHTMHRNRIPEWLETVRPFIEEFGST
jgi:non-heme chloroperoxidase